MQRIKILNRRQADRIRDVINEIWGSSIPEGLQLLISSKDRIYLATRELLLTDALHLRIDSLGLYFGTETQGGFRLSVEGSQIIGPKATRGMVELSDEDIEHWVRGQEVPSSWTEKGFLLVKHDKDFYGTGTIKDGMLLNYYPKSRRVSSVL
jgi:NOL1/NOP2/fmu family ribosome biogenesis protein